MEGSAPGVQLLPKILQVLMTCTRKEGLVDILTSDRALAQAEEDTSHIKAKAPVTNKSYGRKWEAKLIFPATGLTSVIDRKGLLLAVIQPTSGSGLGGTDGQFSSLGLCSCLEGCEKLLSPLCSRGVGQNHSLNEHKWRLTRIGARPFPRYMCR